MPTYEYTCKDCGDHLEVVQSFKDEPLTTCPSCGGPLRKVFGSIGIAFKGSGFYKTDNRSSSSKANGSEKKSDASSSPPSSPSSSPSSSSSSSSSGSSTAAS
ncbi:MAG TPA: FmdB family zinc ribbon protein [Acidimicrobiales bacterium]|nr:FmdB family zinc ribbon protein [Acidimicrobiales bacterium]